MIDTGLIATLAPLLIGGASTLGGIRFIQESQRGVKLRFGKVIRHKNGEPRIYEPGFVFSLPTVHSLRRIHVRTQTLALAPQRVMLSDRTVFTVGALIISHVIDDTDCIYRSLFEVDDVRSSVEEFCAAVLRDVLAASTYDDLADHEGLANQVRERVKPRLKDWGISVDDVKLTDCSPSAETSRMILISTEAKLRTQALQGVVESCASLPTWLSPTLAAALIGTPVSVALTAPQSDQEELARRPPENKNHFSLKIGSADSEAPANSASG